MSEAQDGISATAMPRPAPEDQPDPAKIVLRAWQDLMGHTLRPERVEAFLDHPDLRALSRYDKERLYTAGTSLILRTGTLLLADWVRECAWDGGGTASLDWADLRDEDPDAVIAAREMITEAVNSLKVPRTRVVLTRRLGLDGDEAATLQTIGDSLGVTRQRIQQIEQKALTEFLRHRMPPSASHYVGRMIGDVLQQAEAAGEETAGALLTLATAALPGVKLNLAVQVLAGLTGRSKNARRHLAAEVTTLHATRRAEQAREVREARTVGQASARLGRLLDATEWPAERCPAPPRSAIEPQRPMSDMDGALPWSSMKLGREVAYQSQLELALIRVLDRAEQVAWYCEQPLAIGYTFAGRHHTYYPDFLAVTTDDECVVIEVKMLPDMPLAITQAKADAAREFCACHGWGYLLTDGKGRTLHDLQVLPIPEDAAEAFTSALREAKTMKWCDIKANRERHGLTTQQLFALAIQRGWHIRLNPYRMSEQPPPS